MHTLIEVKVKTMRPTFRVRIENGKIAIDLSEAPENNKANLELVKMLTKLLKEPVSLVSGHRSHRKTLRIENKERAQVLNLLKNS